MGRITSEQEEGATIEEALRLSEERYGALIELLPALVWTTDANGQLDYVNQRGALYTGNEPFEIKLDLVHPQDLEVAARAWQACQQAGGPYEAEIRLRNAEGSYRWHLARALPLRDSAGQLIRWLGACTDIDDQKRAEDAQRFLAEASTVLSSSLDYETTLDNVARLVVPRLADWCAVEIMTEGAIAQVAVAHVDPGKVELARELRRRFPPRPDERFGAYEAMRTGEPLLFPDIPEALIDAATPDLELRRILRELRLRSSIVVPLVAHGVALGAFTLVFAESGRRYGEADVKIASDLARHAALAVENAQLYREAERARATAQTAVKLRDDFLSAAGHELRNPLSALSLQVEGLQRLAEKSALTAEAPKWKQRLDKTSLQVKRIERLIAELLDVSRITEGRLSLELEPVDLVEVVDEVIARTGDELTHSGSLVRIEQSGPVVGNWDHSRLDQVITNLLGNAVKYGSGQPIEIGVRARGPLAELTVTDHGIGVAPEHQERIFERFERAVENRNVSGLGLGLWIVRQIVEALGGTIHLESSPGVGSTFTVELPRDRA